MSLSKHTLIISKVQIELRNCYAAMTENKTKGLQISAAQQIIGSERVTEKMTAKPLYYNLIYFFKKLLQKRKVYDILTLSAYNRYAR